MEAGKRRRGKKGLGLLVRLTSHNGSNGGDIGNRWRCYVNSLHIGTVIIVPKMPVVTFKVMMPRAMPAIIISMGVVIIRIRPMGRLGLGAQGA